MYQALTIGQYTVPFPVIQGGMGVRVSAHRLAGTVAKNGGIGIVASAGLGLASENFNGRNFYAADAEQLQEELRKAYEIAPDGVIGVNCMVAVSDYDESVRAACAGGAKLIISGAGLPMNLPELTADYPAVALVPIVSSVKAAQLICRKWNKSYARLPDAIVVEDPDTAGGHLGEKPEKIGDGSYDQYATVRGVKAYLQEQWQLDIPVIAAGGVWDQADFAYALEQGADGVQMGTRFVVTEECDADAAFKQAYLDCTQEDIGLMMSPAGLPGRALKNNVPAIRQHDLDGGIGCSVNCLKRCAYKAERERFCIVQALERARLGDRETGLIFCGSNAWKATRIDTVADVFAELFPQEGRVAVG